MNQIAQYLITIPAVILTIMLHEISHGYAAYRLGDPTARNMGRLTLNPLKHLDIVGTLCMIFFHFGWAKPVPINTRNFKKPIRDIALTALAGPLTNFLLAFLAVPFFLLSFDAYFSQSMAGNGFLTNLLLMLFYFFYYFHIVNLGLGLFNLIPIPPLDGSRILFAVLPPKYYFSMMRYERYVSFALLLFLFLGIRFGFLTIISGKISYLMESVWRLIPIFH